MAMSDTPKIEDWQKAALLRIRFCEEFPTDEELAERGKGNRYFARYVQRTARKANPLSNDDSK